MENSSVFSRILIPVDGSNASMNAGLVAIEIARQHAIPLIFLYIVDESAIDTIIRETSSASEQVRDELEQKAQRYLNYLCRYAQGAGLKADRVIRIGVPHRETTELARERDVDLIVLGQQVGVGPRRVQMGGMVDRVVEYAPCSVLIVRYSPER
ncbi:MAG: universal stress protein [Anaerolineae bacterium]|nr:universal stress protein [Anaerolineae bacterium]